MVWFYAALLGVPVYFVGVRTGSKFLLILAALFALWLGYLTGNPAFFGADFFGVALGFTAGFLSIEESGKARATETEEERAARVRAEEDARHRAAIEAEVKRLAAEKRWETFKAILFGIVGLVVLVLIVRGEGSAPPPEVVANPPAVAPVPQPAEQVEPIKVKAKTKKPVRRESVPATYDCSGAGASTDPRCTEVRRTTDTNTPRTVVEPEPAPPAGHPSASAAKAYLVRIGCSDDFRFEGLRRGRAEFSANCQNGQRQFASCQGAGCKSVR